MKSEELVLVAAGGAGAGAVLHQAGVSTGNGLIDAGIGIGITALGYFTDIDVASDFMEGVGVGYFLDSVL